MYTVGNVAYNTRSETNIHIIKAFLAREVKMEMTEWVDYVFDTGTAQNAPPIDMTDIEYPAEAVHCPMCKGELKGDPIFASDLHLAPEENPDPECDPDEAYLCPVCGAGHGSYMAATFCCESIEVYVCPDCQNVIGAEEYDDLCASGDMPNEWWAVSPWLFEQLKDRGATTIEQFNLWGRNEISSAVPLTQDKLILEICEDLKILDGQEKSWSKLIRLK